ncbi:uncharacterized protein I303_105216 [Kwoniella dejecticola CBS 10117]|uniref:Aminoglycoside phosphotransferase domain-containing protein n=1 Tax=Kwoniella dejecticola CBS 10117 TaxID=1296121 RepID=A0A1A6A352_9TREE|nr:uncharacterized protein I303_05337 [Kwoniella dejecticola CBS 10117]OBR84479.1 hypothetical protein I303_05337 [Kwoniella dejecticola CBS 10117]
MTISFQPQVNQTNDRRRFFESVSPSKGYRLFIKRSATEAEAKTELTKAGSCDNWYQRSFSTLQNEAYAISFVRKHTSIPVPTIFAIYEDRGCFYMIQEYVEGCVTALHCQSKFHAHIARQLTKYVGELHRLKSTTLRCFTPDLHFPARMQSTRTYLSTLKYPEDPKKRYVLCHGDLGWQNVMVDPRTGDIKAIIDWEYAGFFPVEVEGVYWKRYGAASPRGSETMDTNEISALLFNLSANGCFPKDYRIISSKKQKTDPIVADESKNTTSPPQQSKIKLFISHVLSRKRSAAKKSAIIDENKPDETESFHSTPPPVDEASARKEETEDSTRLDEEVADVGKRIVESGSVQAPYLESSDVPEWQELKVRIPEDEVFDQTIATQVAIASRENAADKCLALGRSIMLDHHALHAWRRAMLEKGRHHRELNKKHFLLTETEHIVGLNTLISSCLLVLGEELTSSAQPISYFQSRQLFTARLHNRYQALEATVSKEKGLSDDQIRGLGELAVKFGLIDQNLHRDRDEAFRNSETIKWNAIHRFAEVALVVSHAAKQLLPYTPDRDQNQAKRRHSPGRKEAEDRARDLILGGTGGWEAEVKPLEDWEPIDHKERGVPDDTESESETESAKGRDAEFWRKMREERDKRLFGVPRVVHASAGEKLDGNDLYLASWAMV